MVESKCPLKKYCGRVYVRTFDEVYGEAVQRYISNYGKGDLVALLI
jgi:hypothetical protein